jgi:hypothetical protein
MASFIVIDATKSGLKTFGAVNQKHKVDAQEIGFFTE